MYKAGTVAKGLSIASSTLRKYSELLEGSGYAIKRSNENNRVYTEQDIEVLKTFIALKKQYPKYKNQEILKDFFDFNSKCSIDNSGDKTHHLRDQNELFNNIMGKFEQVTGEYNKALNLINLRLETLEVQQEKILADLKKLNMPTTVEEKLDRIIEMLAKPKKKGFFFEK
ncbi:MerR family transcriptional regulator [Lysinibacillus odysseyi]|uniref:HTH merR-type domain-containing protein n=1 Tax=Lysinibacillus odysseyi 34hs-1 = NBRC 100172 TaxID=1220589 RepID=A0A0A3JP83_9BACI|nr:MerR family transcriptional regulator [Lysinibacillus odysseyi]KGR88802.1 hypothetical protein CD32_01085 [Lysinibacillus odysseyi 34hs-1 = NBRC 100172]